MKTIWQIKYGLGGGYGGLCAWEDTDATSYDEAQEQAEQAAIEVAESYDMGDRAVWEAEEEAEEHGAELTDDEKDRIYHEEVDNWIDWEVREVSVETITAERRAEEVKYALRNHDNALLRVTQQRLAKIEAIQRLEAAYEEYANAKNQLERVRNA